MIIHISGPSGSGKTHLGKRLKKTFGKKIVVKDLDDLKEDFINKNYKMCKDFEKEKYQEYVNNFINKQKKPLVLVGLNINECNINPSDKISYTNLTVDYKFYIKISDNVVVQQKCERFIKKKIT